MTRLPFFIFIGAALSALLPLFAVAGSPGSAAPAGLSAKDWEAIRMAHQRALHEFAPEGDGWVARNPGQRWTTRFDGRGFLTEPDHGEWIWGLELLAYGRGDEMIPVAATSIATRSTGRLAYQRDETLEEWWINDTRGLEHGYTLARRPGSDGATGPLTLRLGTRGGLVPVVTTDRLGVDFQDAAGKTVLHYEGLKAWDATGRRLASSFAIEGSATFRLLVEDADAVYPVTIDPIAQQAYLKAGNTASSDRFGLSVALSGNTVVVGVPEDDSGLTTILNGTGSSIDNSATDAGSAYVFVRSGSTWSQQAYLKAPNAGEEDNFGATVAISGDTIVVGAPDEASAATGVDNGADAPLDNGAPFSGAAYVFVRNGSTWTQQAFLKAGNAEGGDGFGEQVAISGNTILVSAPFEDSGATGASATITGPIDNSVVLSGAAYVFTRSGTTWSQEAFLKASNSQQDDEFGGSVAISGDIAVVGTGNESGDLVGVFNGPGGSANDNAPGSGAAYVFARSAGVWTQQAFLKAGNAGAGDNFGTSLAVSGETIVVGANFEASNASGVLNGPGGSSDNSSSGSGAAYVFVRSGSTWSQQAYLKAGNAGTDDRFGSDVSISGNFIVVGAPSESSDFRGVSTGAVGPTDNDAEFSGAAYLFHRVGTSWGQIATLKAGNADPSDGFGFAVSVSGGTVIASALLEQSAFTGVENSPGGSADNSLNNAGAAYVFDGLLPRLTLSKVRRFPNTRLKRKSRPQTLTITNVGGTPARGLAAALSGTARRDFVTGSLSRTPLAAGGRRNLSLRFTPKRPGLRRSVLTFRSDAPPAKTTLSGRALKAVPGSKGKSR